MRITDALSIAAVALSFSGCAGAVVMRKPVTFERPPRLPHQLWSLDLAGWGRPAASADSVYVMTRQHDVAAVDSSTGNVRWKSRTGDPQQPPLGSAILVAADRLIVGDSDVIALNRATGTQLWRFAPSTRGRPGVYLGPVEGETVYAGSAGGYLYAIDAATGSLRWSVGLNGRQPVTVFAPTVDRDVVFAGFTRFQQPTTGGVFAVDASTGQELWRTDFPPAPDSGRNRSWAGGPVVAGTAVFAASSDGAICQFDRRTGAITVVIGPESPPRQDFRPLASAGTNLIVGSLDGNVSSYDLRTLKARWSYDGGEHGSIAFAVTTTVDTVYVPYASGILVALDTATGRERWRTLRSQGRVEWAPTVSGNRIYAVTDRAVLALVP